MNFLIKETNLEESLKVFKKIPEWDRFDAGSVEYCNNRIKGRDHLILSAYYNNINIGYLIAYEKDSNFYCWVAAVDPDYRRNGILTEMMKKYIEYAKKHNYNKLTIKTLNNRREMLSYLVKNNWNIINVIPNDNILYNEILLEKEI